MSTYTEAHRKYFQSHKKEIYERTRDTKRACNRAYYERNKARLSKEREAKKKQKMLSKIRNSLYENVLIVDKSF